MLCLSLPPEQTSDPWRFHRDEKSNESIRVQPTEDISIYLFLKAKSTLSDLQFVLQSVYRGPLQQTHALSQSPPGNHMSNPNVMNYSSGGEIKIPSVGAGLFEKTSSHLTSAAKMTNVLSLWIYCLFGGTIPILASARGE